jgi:hypothetical protein
MFIGDQEARSIRRGDEEIQETFKVLLIFYPPVKDLLIF